MARYVAHLKESSFLANVLSLAEKRSFLADITRTPIGKIDTNSPLAQAIRYKDGEIVEIKMPDKIKAIELDARLSGELRESQVAVNVGTGLSQ